MSSKEEFKCIFCKDTFETKEELQVHFRKHGDPNFGQSKVRNEASSSSDKRDDSEMVSCDVCSEVFPTIAKAITHKHKLHPDHDAKYFCPWCGKLFTLKYLLNKHLTTNHLEDKRDITIDSFPCHSCDVEFYVPSAMLYHNRFFHRQDTELPAIGYSRKLKKIKQDLLAIYYCPFCGEEYDNKINLHKHMVDDHFDENQQPEDVFRCPLCEAIFYHLDAYELHLTFHSVDDLYSEQNEIVSQITEFSLEAVPPLMEKVENEVPDEVVENSDISELLSFAMEDGGDSDPDKVKKKRKKHKKSKKSAITLDEFLNMNQDVFGGNLDVHGIEEVPTQIINKSLKPKKKVPTMSPGSKISSADIAKLKQQGIVVKMKAVKGAAQNRQMPLRVPASSINRQPSTSATTKKTDSDPTQVIAKLMNQSNSQIKIFKKPIQSTQVESSENTLQPSDNTSKTNDIVNDQASASESQEKEMSNVQNQNSNVEHNERPKVETEEVEKKNSISNNHIEALQTISKNITIKSMNKPCNSPNDNSTSNQEVDYEMEDKSNHSHLDEVEETKEIQENTDHIQTLPKITELAAMKTNNTTALKTLSKNLIIKKTMSPNPQDQCANETQFSDESNEVDKLVSSTSNMANETDPLKRLSKTVTIKPCQKESDNPIENDESVSDDANGKESSYHSENSTDIDHDPHVSLEKKQQIKTSANIENEKILNNLGERFSIISAKTFNRVPCDQIVQNPIDKNKELHNPESPKPDSLTEFPKHLETLKRLGSHITFTSNKQSVENNENDEKEKDQHFKAETTCHLEALKKLGSNITLKSNKPMSPETLYSEKCKEIDSPPRAVSPLHIQALKKLGSNITLKSSKVDNISPKVTGNEHNLPKNTPEYPKQLQNFQRISNKEPKGNLSTNINKKQISHNESRNSGTSFKNVTTKCITTKNLTQEVNCNMVGKTVKNKITAKELNETEIFSVDDSDDEDFNASSSKLAETKNEVPKNEIKNVNINSQNKKAIVGPARFKNLAKNIEESINKSISNANKALENSLKRLSQHITIKSNKPDEDEFSAADADEDWGQNSDSNDSAGKVKISEVMEDKPNDIPQSYDDDEEMPKSPIVDSPDHSDNDNAQHSDDEADVGSKIKCSTVNKQTPPSANKNLNELKNLSKEICIRPVKRDQSPTASTSVRDQTQTTQQNKITTSNQSNMKMNKSATETKVAQKSMASNKVNTVSKAVTVKTYETETVIEEITTTVTKTIRKLNQTMKQENSSVQTNNVISNNSLIGVRPVSMNQRGRLVGPRTVRPNNPNVRMSTPTSNQLIPLRHVRQRNPRMPNQKVTPSTSQQAQGPIITKHLKIAPNVNLKPSVKRPGPKQAMSMAKKMKESSITSTEVSSTSDKGCMKQYSSASHASESSFVSTTQTNKGNTNVSQIKTQSHSSSSQQVSKVGNLSGMKIMKTAQSQKSVSMEVKNEVTANKSTLDAIEKLQKSGLLVKKPRLEEENVQSDFSDFDETG